MTQTDVFLNGLNINVLSVGKHWGNYGIIQYYGTIGGNDPNEYQYIVVKLPTGRRIFVKGVRFIPVPTDVVQEIVHYVANELGMEIKDEYNNGLQYLAQLVSKVNGEVEKGDLVAWGIGVNFKVDGNLRTYPSLFRLVCSNGLMVPVNSQIANIKKSYDIEKMKETFLTTAQILQNMFEAELEQFRQYKRYTMNQEFAEKLAKTFPQPIIQDIITAGEKKTVKDFKQVDLWTAYNAITKQISNRERQTKNGEKKKLKLTTRFDLGLKATRAFEEEIAKQKAQISS